MHFKYTKKKRIFIPLKFLKKISSRDRNTNSLSQILNFNERKDNKNILEQFKERKTTRIARKFRCILFKDA